MDNGCLGFSEFNGESVEYDCEYEFSGEVSCDDCIFGNCGGEQDPSVNPYGEEE